MSETVSLTECAELLNVSVRSIQRAMRDGFPVKERRAPGKPYRINPAAAQAWWAANRRAPDSAESAAGRARLDEYRAERERIRLEKDRARYLDREAVERAAAAMVAVLNELLRPLSDRIARHLDLDDEQRRVVHDLITAPLARATAGLSAIGTSQDSKNRQ